MNIGIVTTGRFHVADLARELSGRGHSVTLYTVAPVRRVRPHCGDRVHIMSWFWLLWPLVLMERVLARIRWLGGTFEWSVAVASDWLAATFLRPCDVLIGMSGIMVRSARKARRAYGAQILVERGSRHILSQRDILAPLIPHAVPEWAIRRELAGYALADFIVIASDHAADSFIEKGIPRQRLFQNAYGVNLAQFRPLPAPRNPDPPTVIMVGAWSLRKGCHLVTQAWPHLRHSSARLLHVGPLGDTKLPTAAWFCHVAAVPQADLPRYYAQAHVQVLASLEDGFGMVIAQGLACGLVVACSDRTGGPDVRRMIADSRRVVVFASNDVTALATGIDHALDVALSPEYSRTGLDLSALSWASYGARYDAFLLEHAARGSSVAMASRSNPP